MDRRDETEQTVVERPQRPQAPRPTRQGTGPNRTLIIALILGVIGFAALAVVLLNAGEEPVETTDVPESWDSVSPGEGTPVDLGSGRRTAAVIVGVQGNICWSGYIVSAAIEGCGTQQFDVTGAPAVLGANVRHQETQGAFIGISAWTSDGLQRLTGDTTRKRLGLVSITASIPKPGE
jgi:hypothetical protein